MRRHLNLKTSLLLNSTCFSLLIYLCWSGIIKWRCQHNVHQEVGCTFAWYRIWISLLCLLQCYVCCLIHFSVEWHREHDVQQEVHSRDLPQAHASLQQKGPTGDVRPIGSRLHHETQRRKHGQGCKKIFTIRKIMGWVD